MKDIASNPLTKNQRKLLQYGVVLMLCVFLVGYFLLQEQKNTSVFVDDQQLHAFDEIISLEYPNRIELHEPYLLVVQPEEQLTHIFNLDDREIEKTVKEIVLDYQDGKLLYMKNDSTFLDELDLGVLCEKGPVSYTHLDVYKRQHYDGALLDEVLIKLYDSGAPNFENMLALLKGSPMQKDLDVYKRQLLRKLIEHNCLDLYNVDFYT